MDTNRIERKQYRDKLIAPPSFLSQSNSYLWGSLGTSLCTVEYVSDPVGKCDTTFFAFCEGATEEESAEFLRREYRLPIKRLRR